MDHFINELSILLMIAGLFSYLSVILRQPVIIAYIGAGILIGPWGLAWVENVNFIEGISHLGITLLLFLAGLTLQPSKLFEIFQKTTLVVLINSLVSFLIAFSIAMAFDFNVMESLCVGFAMMFSSTILVVKLIPTTRLHHARMGAVCIGVLILQDLMAVGVLAFIRCLGSSDNAFFEFLILNFRLAVLLGILFLFERFVIRKIMSQVERIHEVIFILGLSWCFGVAFISHEMGIFYETGAFFAGVVLARHKISLFIAEKLKSLRDFFLVLFFFTMGAKLDLFMMGDVLLPAILLCAFFTIVKPYVLKRSFIFTGEKNKFSSEAGYRLGQLSEFSLLIALLALEMNVIGSRASQLIQLSTIMTFIVSSYIVVFKYPTPIGIKEQMIKD